MRQVKKRLFAAALSLAMLFSLFPASVFADEAEAVIAQDAYEAENAEIPDAGETEGAEVSDDASLLEGEPENSPQYVLMNIPYADFYAAELSDGAAAVDAVTSATLNKPRTGTLAGGSYHVNSDGSDISGVIYPVFVSDMSALDGKTRVTDDSVVVSCPRFVTVIATLSPSFTCPFASSMDISGTNTG